MNPRTVVWSVVLLGAGTYLTRLAGVLGAHRLRLSERRRALLTEASVVLLMALAATAAANDGQSFAGPSRLLGVAAGALVALCKLPFIVVVLAAAATTALVRLAGMP